MRAVVLSIVGVLGYLSLPLFLPLPSANGKNIQFHELEQWKRDMKKQFPQILHISARWDFHEEAFYLDITCWPWKEDPAQEIMAEVKAFAGQEDFAEKWYAALGWQVPEKGKVPLLALRIFDTVQAQPFHTYHAGWDENLRPKYFERAYGPDGNEPIYSQWR